MVSHPLASVAFVIFNYRCVAPALLVASTTVRPVLRRKPAALVPSLLKSAPSITVAGLWVHTFAARLRLIGRGCRRRRRQCGHQPPSAQCHSWRALSMYLSHRPALASERPPLSLHCCLSLDTQRIITRHRQHYHLHLSFASRPPLIIITSIIRPQQSLLSISLSILSAAHAHAHTHALPRPPQPTALIVKNAFDRTYIYTTHKSPLTPAPTATFPLLHSRLPPPSVITLFYFSKSALCPTSPRTLCVRFFSSSHAARSSPPLLLASAPSVAHASLRFVSFRHVSCLYALCCPP
ncbi:hypothetical protein C8Q78DRAFT_676197 [Trametes maxima]|nr:hypothetical protein C8Q78DRAFT_676197 [Trametes maxima]